MVVINTCNRSRL